MEECEGGIEDCGSADEGHPQPTGPPWPLPPPLHHCWPKDIWKQVHIVLQKQSTLFSLFKLSDCFVVVIVVVVVVVVVVISPYAKMHAG